MDELDNTYLYILGAVIRQAIIDYQSGKRNENNKSWMKSAYFNNYHHYNSAKNYLFSKFGLESLINYYGINLDIGYIRRMAETVQFDEKSKRVNFGEGKNADSESDFTGTFNRIIKDS